MTDHRKRASNWLAKFIPTSQKPRTREQIQEALISNGLWPSGLESESFKAACILRSFCQGGTFREPLRDGSNQPLQRQHEATRLPAEIIRKAKGLVVCSILRAGLWEKGAGGSGVAVARLASGSWSCPAAVNVSIPELGMMLGVDIYDCVLVLNTQESVDAVMRGHCMISNSNTSIDSLYAVDGPLSVAWFMETDDRARRAPVFAYLRHNRYYAVASLDHTAINERREENENFYSPQMLGCSDILAGKVTSAPESLRLFMETLRESQGDGDVRQDLLPGKKPPSDYKVVEEGHAFGVPDPEDPDPFGKLALENQGFSIREAGTGRPASQQDVDFTPKLGSPVHDRYYGRNRGDAGSMTSGRTSWRRSNAMGSIDRFDDSPAPSSPNTSSPRTSAHLHRPTGSETEIPSIRGPSENTTQSDQESSTVSRLGSEGLRVDTKLDNTGSIDAKSSGPGYGETSSRYSPHSQHSGRGQGSLDAGYGNGAESARSTVVSPAPMTIDEEWNESKTTQQAGEATAHHNEATTIDTCSVESTEPRNGRLEPTYHGQNSSAPDATVDDSTKEETVSDVNGAGEDLDKGDEKGGTNTEDGKSELSLDSGDGDDDDDDDEFDDADEEVEIVDGTQASASAISYGGIKAVAITKPKVVDVAKAVPPTLPTRNPGRVSTPKESFTDLDGDGGSDVAQESGEDAHVVSSEQGSRKHATDIATSASAPAPAPAESILASVRAGLDSSPSP